MGLPREAYWALLRARPANAVSALGAVESLLQSVADCPPHTPSGTMAALRKRSPVSNMYPLLRPLLFALDPETAHGVTLNGLDWANAVGATALLPKPKPQPVKVLGLEFPNPVGVAAGLDKNADHLNSLGALGFGFVEVGTVTPRPQPGNPKPRLFRLPEHQAIINRMGFNNLGVEHLVEQVKKRRYQGILGINIGKNFDTPVEDAASDYRLGMEAVYVHADYITVNISSPNTPGLRGLQHGDSLNTLLETLKQTQQCLEQEHGRYVPVVVKIAPDMDEEAIKGFAQCLLAHELDGVIATNTTLARDAVAGHRYGEEAGGLSGAPVTELSTQVIAQLKAELGETMPIIGVGGIMSGSDAVDKIRAGASLVQLYSGLIYRGPGLLRESAAAIAAADVLSRR